MKIYIVFRKKSFVKNFVNSLKIISLNISFQIILIFKITNCPTKSLSHNYSVKLFKYNNEITVLTHSFIIQNKFETNYFSHAHTLFTTSTLFSHIRALHWKLNLSYIYALETGVEYLCKNKKKKWIINIYHSYCLPLLTTTVVCLFRYCTRSILKSNAKSSLYSRHISGFLTSSINSLYYYFKQLLLLICCILQ